jgi:hypothetical protein
MFSTEASLMAISRMSSVVRVPSTRDLAGTRKARSYPKFGTVSSSLTTLMPGFQRTNSFQGSMRSHTVWSVPSMLVSV